MDTPETTAPVSATEPRTSYLEEKAFKSRTLLIFGTVTDVTAADVTRRLIALDADSADPIDVLVSSPGGHLESGDAIHDMISFVRAPVTAVGTGWVASAGAHIFLAPPKDRRVCLPNTRFMIHQPAGGAGGQAVEQGLAGRVLAGLDLARQVVGAGLQRSHALRRVAVTRAGVGGPGTGCQRQQQQVPVVPGAGEHVVVQRLEGAAERVRRIEAEAAGPDVPVDERHDRAAVRDERAQQPQQRLSCGLDAVRERLAA